MDIVPLPSNWLFDGLTIRAGLLESGEPYFIAADVCAVAGHSSPWNALERLDSDQKGTISISTLGGEQKVLYVTLAGYFTLVLTFRLRKDHPYYERLKRFQKWVTSEVLPALLKHGRYEMTSAGQPLEKDPILAQLSAIWEIRQAQIDAENRLAEIEEGMLRIDAKAEAALQATSGDSGFVTLRGFCKRNHVEASDGDLSRLGRELARLCREQNIPYKPVCDERHGEVNAYPKDVIERFREWKRGGSNGKCVLREM